MHPTEDLYLDPTLRRAITQAVKEALSGLPFKQAAQPNLVLRMGEVSKLIGLSASTIRNFLDVDGPWFDPSFPQPIRLGNGTGTRCSIGWRRVDIEAWVESRPVHRNPHQVTNASRKAKPERSRGQYTPQRPVLPGGQVGGTSGYLSNSQRSNEDKWRL
ncbi:MAG: helix-turn-helix transcriptional regulator [Dyella sp.]|uniref:helix-turn-helix transcriptional regulator n=1 Tax=Dyella sp. TaxID=1869338 RepID=UPI003F7EE58D